MRGGVPMNVIPFVLIAQLPGQFTYWRVNGDTQEKAVAKVAAKMPWYKVTAYWHEPTKTLYVPMDRQEEPHGS